MSTTRYSNTVLILLSICVFFQFVLAGRSSANDSHSSAFSSTVNKTTAYIEREMEKFNVTGLSIALVSGNRTVWSQGFGWADREHEVSATADTIYNIGSVNKVLTSAAILRLVDQGKMSLDTPVTHYIPELNFKDRFTGQMEQMTMRRLLNQHSGIPGDIYNSGFLYTSSWNRRFGCDTYRNWLLDYLKTDYLSLPPGTVAVYSNTAYALAGEAALRQNGLPGETYAEFLDRELFTPLGMSHSSLHVIEKNLAVGYRGGHPTPPLEANCIFGATGGTYTTVKDMARFLMMAVNDGQAPDGGTYLKTETLDLLGVGEQTALDIDSGFLPGLGLDSRDDPVMRYAGRAWLKNGSTGSFVAFIEMLPDMNLGVAVMTNTGEAGPMLAGVIRECLKNAVLEKQGLPPAPPDLADYPSLNNPSEIAGYYFKNNGYDHVRDNGDGTLTWLRNAHTDTPETVVLKYHDGYYISDARSESISFQNIVKGGKPYFVMIKSGSDGSIPDEYIYGGYVRAVIGEKHSVPPFRESWRSRLGVYVMDNLSLDDLWWDEPFLKLNERDNLLVIDGAKAAIPDDDDTAFLIGLTNRGDSSIRVIQDAGREKLLFGGYRVYPLNQVPAIVKGKVVDGQVDVYRSDWYRYDARPGETVTFTVTTDGPNYALTLFDPELNDVGREMAALTWTTKSGSYYLAVTPTPKAGGHYSMMVE